MQIFCVCAKVMLMTPEQVIKHYGSEQAAADALKMTRQAINYWKLRKVIPTRTQAFIQLKTNGALRAQM